MSLVEIVETAIATAESGTTKLTPKVFNLVGYSGRKGRIFLNEVVANVPNVKYVEVGVLGGSTFVSAVCGNDHYGAIAIDNFTQFGGKEETFRTNCHQCGVYNYTLINNDCFNLTTEQKEIIKGANVYFYDGEHTEEDQTLAWTYYVSLLADEFIIVIDDWNHPPVKSGTRKGIIESGVNVVEEWEVGNPKSSSDADGWHNMVYIAVCNKPKQS